MQKITQLLEPARSQVQKPLEYKLNISRTIIKQILSDPDVKPCVSCSFGKDSMLVLYLVREFRSDIPVIFCNTGVEHPDTHEFIRKVTKAWNLNLIEFQPERTFWDILRTCKLDDGVKHKNSCCYHLKHKPLKKIMEKYNFTHSFTGITVIESRHRNFTVCKFGLYYKTKKYNWYQVHPIAFWLPEDVWKFTKEHNIPIHPAYSKGYDRLGCITCTSFRGWKKQMNEHFPLLYKKIMKEGFNQEIL